MSEDATPDRVANPGWITREEHLRIVEQINRARRLEQTANFDSGRRYERELARGIQTGSDAVTIAAELS